MGGDPGTPEGLNAGLAAADEQNPGQVDQICETCPDNWVETGATDESTGKPLPNLPYRIYEIATRNEVARGVLDANGRSPRHQIPMPATQLFVMFGTDEAIDEAMERMDALQRKRTVQENARPEWRGFKAGLSQEEFNARHRELIESGTFVDEDRGFFEGAISGARGIGNLVGSLATGQGLTGWAESEYARRRDEAWDQYQLATGARVAGRRESLGAGADQSASFYFGDEISARLGSLLDERSYEEIIDDHRHILHQSRLSNPGY